MRRIFLTVIALSTLLLSTKAQTITAPPASSGLDSYYTQYVNCNGINIIASKFAPDSALEKAYEQVKVVTEAISPAVLEAITAKKPRLIVMGRYEGISQLPDMKNETGIQPWWDIHYRGWAATDAKPVMLGAEENILAYQIDPNYAEDILVNTLAKTVMTMGISKTDPSAMQTLNTIYAEAKAKGKWKNTIAIENAMEYWAEGVQSWFGVNAESPLPDGRHNWVNTRSDLKKYDPQLYSFIAKYIDAKAEFNSVRELSNLYKKDDKKAWAKLHEEPELNIKVPECKVERVDEEMAKTLKLDTRFYKKHVDCNGIHILSSDNVPDSCLKQTHKTIYCMTSMLPKAVLDAMTRVNTRVVVMGSHEVTIEVPEHSNLRRDRSMNWNLRARGLGGDINEPITSCAEENVMAHTWDKYHAEDILIHEFSHSIHLIGIVQVDPTINQQLRQLLDQALAEGKWVNTYASNTIEEYWAEGVQNWFNVNAEVAESDTKHNRVNTREELKRYDPRLYNLIAKYFPETNAQIGKHRKENRYDQQ